ncbi:digestive cysteine proteinase 1 [Patagioenas fasciata monilis]|uniref:Digestive cysteine proteinase 1 n=1 Tax=Patagioenas fasciata monilis TaxID=372326 RepID=A0A1V4JCM1_PATFA|nr:digestive cysteine proteinase 1 [Patagioenas fasciata monilis]
MAVLRWLAASALCIAVWGPDCVLSRPPPQFGSIYHVRGVINLPYAEIEEPFEAWYNLTGNKSRIQYYGGQVITYQLGGVKPYGMQYKITPETTEKKVNTRACFQLPGSKEDVVKAQSVFPSMDGFKFLREEYYRGRYCAVWQNVTRWAQKKNVYTLWVTNSSCGVAPVHYEMRGYNSLLGSHYDKYEIAYTEFDNSFPPSIFDIPINETKKCGDLPGTTAEHRVLANPMEDLVGRHQPWAHEAFHQYRRRLGRRYGSARELEHRQSIFVHNMRYGGMPTPPWWIKHGGIATTESYGTYKGQNGLCHYNQSEMLAKITGYVNVTSGNITAVKAAIYKHGPVAVSIDASHKTFSFYSNGIYYEPKCANKPGSLDHAVLAVGYGVLQGETYWLIKNSWSTYWGNDGYILMAMRDNNCGVATEATYPILA